MAVCLWSHCGKPGPFCWAPQKLTRTWGPSLSPEAGWLHPERSMWHFTRALSSSPGGGQQACSGSSAQGLGLGHGPGWPCRAPALPPDTSSCLLAPRSMAPCFSTLLGFSGASMVLKPRPSPTAFSGGVGPSPPSPLWNSATERSCRCFQVSVSVH